MTQFCWTQKSTPDGAFLFAPAAEIVSSIQPGRYILGDYPPPWFLRGQKPRTDSIVKTQEVQLILDRVEDFFLSRNKYKAFNRAHKRGILLHGAPGTGKSTILRALSDWVVESGGVVIDSFSRVLPEALQYISNIHPDMRKLVVVDEVEVFKDSVAVLNLLDGQERLDNVAVVATTNKLPSELPARFIRPGRFDCLLEVTLPSLQTRRNFFSQFGAEELAEATEGLTLAQLNEVFVATKILGESLEEVLRAFAKGESVELSEEELERLEEERQRKLQKACSDASTALEEYE